MLAKPSVFSQKLRLQMTLRGRILRYFCFNATRSKNQKNMYTKFKTSKKPGFWTLSPRNTTAEAIQTWMSAGNSYPHSSCCRKVPYHGRFIMSCKFWRSVSRKHFRSLVSTLISRNTKSSTIYSRNLVNTGNFQWDFIKWIILKQIFTYLSFELFSKVDLMLGLQSWIWVARIFFYLSSYFQCFFLPLWYLANIMCENLSPSWSEIRVDINFFL